MKKRILSVAIAALCVAGALEPVQAQTIPDGKFMVRARATRLAMDTSSEAGALPGNAIDVNSKWIPEVDLSYFFTRNLAAELVLTIPQSQTVTVAGNSIGTFKHLPPTLLVQWHFDGMGAIKPYVGAGLNYTAIFSNNMAVGTSPVTLDKHSIGFALQAGLDYKVRGPWWANVDVKKVQISSDVYLSGNKISNVKLDPWVLSVGVGYRF